MHVGEGKGERKKREMGEGGREKGEGGREKGEEGREQGETYPPVQPLKNKKFHMVNFTSLSNLYRWSLPMVITDLLLRVNGNMSTKKLNSKNFLMNCYIRSHWKVAYY